MQTISLSLTPLPVLPFQNLIQALSVVQVWLSFNQTLTHQQEVTVMARLVLKLFLHKRKTSQSSYTKKSSTKQKNSDKWLRR